MKNRDKEGGTGRERERETGEQDVGREGEGVVREGRGENRKGGRRD